MKKLLTILLFCAALIAKGQDTTYNTYSYACDSTVTTTIPEQIIQVGNYDSVIFDTSYAAYSIYQNYWIVDGSVIVTLPIYVTIPEHDTTFVCHLCGTCYKTDTIITPSPTLNIRGLFPNNSSSLASRLHLTKTSGDNAFRDNLDVGKLYKVKWVHDSGLIDLMTFNSPPCCKARYFPKDDSLLIAVYTLDSTLAAADEYPEIISFNNEEPNFSYWKGTATDYIKWLTEATKIAHKYKIPVSNGGLLHNIFWYIRWVYQQEGKTDSVAMINAAESIGPGTPNYAQVVIDWYKVEMPGLIAANVDYINFHFYNPKDKNESTAAPSNTLAITLKFLGRYNKPLITTETGTNNHNQALFNAHMDIIKNAGVKTIVYYLGTGPLSEENLPYWTAWLLQ